VCAALLWRGPLLLDFWGSDILRLEIRPWLIRRLMRRAIRRADRIHSVSAPMTALLVALGAEPSRIETFQYGVDLTRFSAAPAPRASQRILSSRGLRDFYRIATVVAALPAVLAERPAAQLAITGAGEQLPGLQALAARLGVADSVHFLGYVPEEELIAELQRAAVWVSVPPSDGTPLSLLEAMACGALPVVSDLATVREWLDEQRAVFVAEVTPERLAAALLRGLELAEAGAYAGPNRRLVEERGDRARNLPRWERLLAAAAGRLP
jgi:L-malate glycosyltransferase